MLVPSKISHQNNKFVRNTYNKCRAGFQHGTSPVVSFSRIFSKYLEAPENACYSFFWLQCVKLEYTLFVSSKIRRPALFSCKLITFNSRSINSPRETAVDIVLDVSENFQGNVYSEVLSKVVVYQHGVC